MATKFYLTTAAPTYTPPTIRGTWDQTAGAIAKALDTSKTGGGVILPIGIAEATATNPWRVLLGRFISGPLAAGTIGGAGTLDVLLGVYEINTSANFHWYFHVYVTQGDTDTPRGTLLSNYSEALGVNEWTSSGSGKAFNAVQALGSVTLVAGDRIVLEIGYISRNTSASSLSGFLYYGTLNPSTFGFASDLTLGSAAIDTLAGFVTFSDTITETGGGSVRVSSAPVVILQSGDPSARVSSAPLLVLRMQETPQGSVSMSIEVPLIAAGGGEHSFVWMGDGQGGLWVE